MPEPDKLNVKVEEPAPEPETQGPDVTVDLTPKPEGTQKPEPTTPAPDITALQNQLAGAKRINNQLSSQVAQLSKDLETLKQGAPASDIKPSGDPTLDDLLEQGRFTEWAEAIAERKVLQKLQEQEVMKQQKEMETHLTTLLEESRREVATRYPQLDPQTGNEEDPFSQVFDEVVNQMLNENPAWRSSPHGPIAALRRAEKVARERGIPLKPAKLTPSTTRNGNATSLPPSRSAPVNPNHVTLTREQAEAAKSMGVSPEEYARSVRDLEEKGAVEA